MRSREFDPILYEVVVGNIGTVYSGDDKEQARSYFNVYKEQSESGYGRAAGESVYLMADGDIRLEYQGTAPINGEDF